MGSAVKDRRYQSYQTTEEISAFCIFLMFFKKFFFVLISFFLAVLGLRCCGGGRAFLKLQWAGVLGVHLCPTLCNPLDYGPPVSSVHGILQARMLEWVAIIFSRGSSRSRLLNSGRLNFSQILYHHGSSQLGLLSICTVRAPHCCGFSCSHRL